MSHFEFIECNSSYCDENPYSVISDRNLVDTMVLEEIQIDNEITNILQVKIIYD